MATSSISLEALIRTGAASRAPLPGSVSFREARHAVRLPATWLRREGPVELMIREASFGGFAAEAEILPPRRHLIRCQVRRTNSPEPFVFHAMIVHHLDPEGSRPAFGAVLYALDREGRQTWGNLIQYLLSHPGELDAA